jgi:hypothetical protein
MHPSLARAFVPFLLLLAAPLPVQDPKEPGPTKAAPAVSPQDKADEATMKEAIARLMSFASNATGSKVLTRAKEAYDLILGNYDENHAGARQALGQKKVGNEWKEAGAKKTWKDTANDDQRFRVMGEWVKTCKDLARIHRTRGLKIMAEDPVRGVFHLRRATWFDPTDKESHTALGHEELALGANDKFYGTKEEIAFVQRLREIETMALTLAKKDFPVEPIAEIPEELKKTNLEFHGAKSATFTIFTRGTQENADNCVKWAERGLEFMEWLLGDKVKSSNHRQGYRAIYAWRGFVWTPSEKELFLKSNPELIKGEKGAESAERFANISWSKNGKLCEVDMKLTPAQMHDALVGKMFKEGFGGGDHLREGLMHASTWYLMSTTITRYGALPEGTAASRQFELPDSANWWLREIRDQATAGSDMPLQRIPRLSFAAFPNDARIKVWSFMTWLLARYPENWAGFVQAIPDKKMVSNEEVDAASVKHLGRPILQVEAEWREWASGRGGVAAATGYGPPLLPERPNPEQVEGLHRLNQVRRLCGLPECDLDAEATIACKEHALYLAKYPEHHKWPEAHEQSPAKEGFTPRGMRAGLRSVIVINATGAEDSVDGWLGTVYHRFPLLEYNINRIGFAFEERMCVLDMGSLEEPRDPEKEEKYMFARFPFDGMKNVPLAFHAHEFPNPLGDQPADQQDDEKIGYPVSLQFSYTAALNIVDGSITLYELKRSTKLEPVARDGATLEDRAGAGKARAEKIQAEGKRVDAYEHTPKTPMLKRMELKDVVFLIPKTHLEPNTYYGVVATVSTKSISEPLYVSWSFTTGDQRRGLGNLPRK